MERPMKLARTAVGLALMTGVALVVQADEPVPAAVLAKQIAALADEADPSSSDFDSTESTPSQNPDSAKPAAPRPAPKPYKDLFFKNDFSYLDAPDYVSCDFFDLLKRIPVAPCTTLDIGGEYRMRYHDEQNMARSRLNGEDNEFLLQRTRLYGDLKYNGWLRGYAEFLDATSSWEDHPPRTIEENRADFINLFVEAKLMEDCCGGSLSARVGRQELLFGNQRLISPLDWSNTRRTFDGADVFWKSKTWDVDAFWTRPVPFSQHQFNDHNFDHPDQSQEFMGVYATWHEIKDHTWDFYYIRFEEDDLRANPILDSGAHLGSFDANTIGARYQGRCCDWLWEFEGAYQFGDYLALDQTAGFFTIGLGYDFKDLPWKPVFWTYFDWASGDSNPTDGDRGTFNQLFPLGHKYMGFMDLVARQNIEDWNFLLTAKPCDKVTLLAWWHIFHLEEARDSLYNAAGGVIRTDATGTSGTDVGQELDFIVQVQMTPHADILFGYSHFFTGDYISDAAVGAQSGNDADFFYTQFSFKF
jgi:hypothetical protein